MMEVMTKHPPIRQNYAAFTNQGFLQREVGVVAERLLDGATEKEIQREILEHDLFQLPSSKSRQTIVRAVLKRLDNVPTSLLEHLAYGSLDLRRLTNLYLLLLQHRLLREFVAEVILEAFSRFNYLVPLTEINAFITCKRSQVLEIDGWSEATLGKSRSNLVNICVSAGLLRKEGDGWSIQPQSVPPSLRQELIEAERQKLLHLLLDPEAI